MTDLEKPFPMYFGTDHLAKLLKDNVVRPLRSHHNATFDHQTCCLLPVTLASDFCFTGDYLTQRYLASMERVVLSGKLTAQAIYRQQAIASQQLLARAA